VRLPSSRPTGRLPLGEWGRAARARRDGLCAVGLTRAEDGARAFPRHAVVVVVALHDGEQRRLAHAIGLPLGHCAGPTRTIQVRGAAFFGSTAVSCGSARAHLVRHEAEGTTGADNRPCARFDRAVTVVVGPAQTHAGDGFAYAHRTGHWNSRCRTKGHTLLAHDTFRVLSAAPGTGTPRAGVHAGSRDVVCRITKAAALTKGYAATDLVDVALRVRPAGPQWRRLDAHSLVPKGGRGQAGKRTPSRRTDLIPVAVGVRVTATGQSGGRRATGTRRVAHHTRDVAAAQDGTIAGATITHTVVVTLAKFEFIHTFAVGAPIGYRAGTAGTIRVRCAALSGPRTRAATARAHFVRRKTSGAAGADNGPFTIGCSTAIQIRSTLASLGLCLAYAAVEGVHTDL